MIVDVLLLQLLVFIELAIIVFLTWELWHRDAEDAEEFENRSIR